MENRSREFQNQPSACDRADRLGILCSCLCATHCLGCPVLFSIVPAVAASGLWGTIAAGKLLALSSLVFAWFSVGPTLQKASSKTTALLTVVGVMFVLTTAFAYSEPHENQFVRHSAACQCVSYCAIPPGMCVAETADGDTRLIPLQSPAGKSAVDSRHPALRDWISICGAVLLVIGHLQNLKSRKNRLSIYQQEGLPSLVNSSSAPHCYGSGRTSTLTSKRC